MTDFAIHVDGDYGRLTVDGEAPTLFGRLVGCDIRRDVPLPRYPPLRPADIDMITPAPLPVVEATLRLRLGPDDHLTLLRNGTMRGVHGPTGDYAAAAREEVFRAHVKDWLEDADTWDGWPTIMATILGVLDATRIDDDTDANEQQRGYRAAADDVRRAIARALGIEAAGG